jgi:hypothetical protein
MIVATHNLDDFTLWNNDSPIIVEKDLFSVVAQGRAPRGRKMGTRNSGRANSRASLVAMPVLREQFWLPCRNILFCDKSNDDVFREMAS